MAPHSLALALGLLLFLLLAAKPVSWLLRCSGRIARRRALCILAAGLVPVAGRLAMLPRMPVPEPAVHDEFSYLLGAETFASGRLVNPPHPMGRYFETFHVQFEPTYISKYLPGQAAVLGLGQAATGHPWAGVLFSVAGMCAAMCWMLYGWLPARWALLGTLLAVAHFSLFTYWTDSYWGGALPAAAGALVLGAYPRIRRFARTRDSFALGVGAALLAVSRPLEGMALCLPVGIGLAVWSWRTRRLRWMLPAAVVLTGVVVFLGYYNYRATGDPLLLPYRLHEMRYGVAPLFVLGGLRPAPEYTDARFRRYWAEWDVGIYHAVRGDLGEFLKWKWASGGAYYFRSWPSIVAGLLLPLLLVWRRARFPLAVAAVLGGTLLLEKAALAHYAAPGASLMILLAVLGIFMLSRWRPGGYRAGRLLAQVVAGGWITLFLWQFARPPAASPLGAEFRRARSEVISRLHRETGGHLVLVRYGDDHVLHHEWIYNAADIDGSRIVWARGKGAAEDAPLLDYYADRTVWELDADRTGAPLTRLRAPESHQLSKGIR